MIYFSSDLHLNHSKNFIYKPRGFSSIEEMNNTIIKNFNEIITPEDDLYLLGDNFLGELEPGIELFKQIPGKIHLVWGNHDTDTRKTALSECTNVVEICGFATVIHPSKWHLFCSHFPANTTNFDDYKKTLRQRTLNLHGHTHSKEKFNHFGSYNVAVDAHNCYPVSFETIKNDFLQFYVDYVAIHAISE